MFREICYTVTKERGRKGVEFYNRMIVPLNRWILFVHRQETELKIMLWQKLDVLRQFVVIERKEAEQYFLIFVYHMSSALWSFGGIRFHSEIARLAYFYSTWQQYICRKHKIDLNTGVMRWAVARLLLRHKSRLLLSSYWTAWCNLRYPWSLAKLQRWILPAKLWRRVIRSQCGTVLLIFHCEEITETLIWLASAGIIARFVVNQECEWISVWRPCDLIWSPSITDFHSHLLVIGKSEPHHWPLWWGKRNIWLELVKVVERLCSLTCGGHTWVVMGLY